MDTATVNAEGVPDSTASEIVTTQPGETPADDTQAKPKDKGDGFNPVIERLKRERDAERKVRADLEAKLENERKLKLKEKEDWKSYSQQLEEENKTLKEEKDSTLKAVIFEKQLSAAQKAAASAGMISDAVNDLDRYGVEQLEIETTSRGSINVIGADDFIARLRKERPYLFRTKGSAVNSDTPTVQKGSGPSDKELDELRDKARKSGDWSAYEKALLEYRKAKNI